MVNPCERGRMQGESIFDLSPPEKLQLVEDLWDDLAAVPADVPCMIGSYEQPSTVTVG